MSAKATVLHHAEFNPKLKTYILATGTLIMALTVFGIVLVPFWWLIGHFYMKRYYERLECELTSRSLRFKKGYIFHTERTIPLDKIQDLTFKEGPLLKYFGLSILRVETAGNTGQGSADLSLIGIVDSTGFRNMVLDQRDKVTENTGSSGTSETESNTQILKDIRDTLLRIESNKRNS